ncbi:MAG: hypothetical protein OSA88_12600 [Acidimicrobiales bacterium]|nr:hypothetical protein [Acidimicrobiales bacterium]
MAQWRKDQGDEGKVYNEPRLLDGRESWHPDFFKPILERKKKKRKKDSSCARTRVLQNLRSTCETELNDVHPLHVVAYWMNNSVRIAQKHYLQITDDFLKAGCGLAAPDLFGANVGAEPSLIAPHVPSAKTQTLHKEAFHVIDHHGSSVAFLHGPQMGDEGLERFSYYSIKHDVLDQPPEQVGANATLSETVALLIESWSRMTRSEKAWVNILVQPRMGNCD